jgi:multiple sugar transport system substrate-binding protein
MFSKDGKEVVLNQPAGVEALQFFQDLMYKFRVAPPQEGRPDARKLFTQGKMLVYEDSQTIIGQLRSDIKGAFAWDVIPVPKGKGATRASSGGGSGYSMANPAANREEAWAYFKHLAGRQSQEIWMTAIGAMVPFKALVESPAFLQPPPDHMSLFVEGASLLRLDPTAVRWAEIDPILTEELTGFWTGAQPAKQVADNVKRRVDPLLK